MERTKHIVILGAGFAGLYSYLELHAIFHKSRKVNITLVNKNDYFLFAPMIHEVATGNLAPSSIIQSIRTIPQCCLNEFIQGEVVKVDLDNRSVGIRRLKDSLSSTCDAKDECVVNYDYLIMGLGSQAHCFGVPGAREFGLTLKTLRDAKLIKNRIIQNFERAQHETGESRESSLTFVIVGGGPTGVELAGEISDLINNELAKAFPDIAHFAKVIIIHGKDALVEQVDSWFANKAKEILNKKNVTIRYSARVTRVDEGGVYIGDEFIPTRAPIWTAGVKACDIDIVSGGLKVETEPITGRIKVNSYLQIPGHEECFVIGDQACVVDKESGQPYPMRAQFAVREGKVVARNISSLIAKKPLREFEWRDKGFIVSLGKGGALADSFGVKFSGPFAWWLYRTVYLFKLIGVRMKLRTALEWTINLFTPRDISKL